MKLRELVTVLSYDLDEAGLRAAEQGFKKLKSQADQVAQVTGKAGRALTTWVTLPILAMGVAFTKAASDAVETESKFEEVFKGIGEAGARATEDLSKNFGLSTQGAQDLLSGTGDVLTGFGFARDESLKLSLELQKLAVDLTSFKNYSGGAAGASSALTKALLGEREALKGLGIAVLEEDIKAKMLEQSMKGMVFQSQRQAKVYATLAIIRERAANSVGDFARTQDALTNSTRVLWERVKDLSVAFGRLLIPVITPVVNWLQKAVAWLSNTSDRFKILILVVGGLVAILGPLLLGIAGIAAAVGFLAQGLTFLAGAALLADVALLPIIGTALAIVAAIAAVVLIVEDLWSYIEGGPSIFGAFIEKLTQWGDELTQWASGVAKAINDWFKPIVEMASKFSNFIGGEAKMINKVIYDASSFTRPSAPSVSTAATGQVYQQNSIRMSVDARGQSPTETTEAVRSGVETGLSDTIRGAKQNFTPARKY